MRKELLIFLSALFTIIDIKTKSFMENFLAEGDFVIWGSLKFHLSYNDAIAFSLPLKGKLLLAITTIVLLGFAYYAYIIKAWKNNYLLLSVSLVFGGALGNFAERLGSQGVTDFIQVFSWYPTFNLADVFIFSGVMMLIWFEWKNKKS